MFESIRPENAGIKSSAIRKMVQKFEEKNLYMHSFLLMKGDKVFAEGYYPPFSMDKKHRMYSISKSFVATAIGVLCDEGKISLSDKLMKFFPEYDAPDLHPFLKETTIEHLLMMCSPHEQTYPLWDGTRSDWVESFFKTKPNRPSGTNFLYDTSGSFILDVIVEKLTGKTFLKYLQDAFLTEMGFSKDAWCVESPDGYAWGGSGVLCTTRDLARLALVYLNGGRYNGKQVLSESFVKAATAKKTATDSFGNGGHDSYGYGYQIWRSKEGFAFNGMGNQHAICVPEKNLLFACTADCQGNPKAGQAIADIFYEYIADNMAENPIPADDAEYAALLKDIENLSLHLPAGARTMPMEKEINGVWYNLEENPMGITKVRLDFHEDGGVFSYENARGAKEIPFGRGAYQAGVFPETHYSGKRMYTPLDRGYRMLATGVWQSENTFLIRVNIVDDFLGNLNISFGFRDNGIGIRMAKVAECFLQEYSGLAGGYKA